MPYNYLLDPKMRKANKIDLQNTIIILDEAHNVEKMCEESASSSISSTQIALAIEDVSHVSLFPKLFCIKLNIFRYFIAVFLLTVTKT